KMPFKKNYTDLENIYAIKELKESIILLERDITKIYQNLKRIAREIYYLYEAMTPEEFEEFEESEESNSDYILSKKKIHKVNKILLLNIATNPTPLNIACLETLALNVLKNLSPEKIASDINIPELDPCSLCNQELFLYEIKKSITLLNCGHLYHRDCIESSIKISSKCPKPDCMKDIESVSDTSKKRTNDPKLFSDKPSNKKAKKPVKKESHILKDLINELSTKPETSQVSVTRKKMQIILSISLSKRLEHYKKSNPHMSSLLLVNEEVRKQIPNITDTMLWKKVERSRKLYTLFINIGEEKIQK
ncbi:12843_t:CDS:2, partial [Gigaspora rosea]